jgi:hypothetical protein
MILTADIGDTRPEVVIVNAARELDRRNAPVSQVGIQFVQIGHDEAATQYLEALDNSLKSQHDVRVCRAFISASRILVSHI